MNYILIFIIILLICVVIGLWNYKKKPIIIFKCKEFTVDNISCKADIIDSFYAIAWNKIMRFQADSIRLKRNEETGKYLIEDINATCIEGENKGISYYFAEEAEIYMTKNDLMDNLQ